jgi:predicted negative regulator of RcsB-dependent stress response
MTEHNVFNKKHIEEVTQAKQTLLDELNLPPQATTFIRENKRTLLAAFLLVIFSICGRSYYIHYTAAKIDRSAGALAQALIVKDESAKLQALQAVIQNHPGTGASEWATITLAQEHIKNKQYPEAITILQTFIASLKQDAPELILCKLILAYSYEENGQNELALTLYKEIRDIHEFMVIGNINVARVYEKMGNKSDAVDAYEKAAASPVLSQPEKDWLKDRIHHLSVT